MRKSLLAGAVMLVVFFLGACSKTPTPSPVPPTPTPQPPLPVTTVAPTVTPFVLPAPAEGKGNVHGLLDPSGATVPLQETELYLGDIFWSEKRDFSVYYFDRSVHPRARWLNPTTGEFLFEDVSPGEYVLILWWDLSSYVAVRDLSGKAIQLKVVPGQTLELGVIVSGP